MDIFHKYFSINNTRRTQRYNSHHRSAELAPAPRLVSGGLVGGGGGSVGLHLGGDSLAFVGHGGNIASVSVYRVGHLLRPAVGEGDVVAAAGGVPVPVLVGAVVVAGVVVLHAVAVAFSWRARQGRRGPRARMPRGERRG